jgi:hypothetical protein
LKALKLTGIKSGDFENIPFLHPNLEDLSLVFEDPSSSPPFNGHFISGLTRLRRLFLQETDVREIDIHSMLASCQKLSHVYLYDCPLISYHIFLHFNDYALKCPQRVVKLHVDLKFDGEMRDSSQRRINGNLWVYFDMW